MTIFLILVLILIVFLQNSRVAKQLSEINETLVSLRKILNESSSPQLRDIQEPKRESTVAEEPKSEAKQEEQVLPDFIENIPEEPEKEKEEISNAAFSENIVRPVSSEASYFERKEKEKWERIASKKKEPAGPSFMERNPDLEKFVGENLINKIGIAILVLGIAFFVKYAIDQNWINEVARVGIGILCGGILIGIAHKLRNSFKSFSSVLVGGGICVLYFTIAIAFHEYHILGQTASFIIMVLITAFAVLLSLTYDRIELAIVSILGGFATPFILSTGDGNYVVLFTYLSILNVGMLVLAYFKKWNLINIISYVLTVLIFGAWIFSKALSMENPPYEDILLFGTLFYVIFFLMNIVNNVKSQVKFNSTEISILISNTFLYYSVGMTALQYLGNGQFQGLFTAVLGIINFIFAFILYKKEKVDRNLVYLLIGLVLTFVSLAGPVQLEGNYITLFWAAEAVLLLWLSIKSEIKIIAYASILVTVLMILSLIIDWQQIYFYSDKGFTIIFNQGFITGIFVIASLIINQHLVKINLNSDVFEVLNVEIYRRAILGVSVLLIYITGLVEFNFQLDQHIANYPVRSIILASYHFSFFFLFTFLAERRELKNLINFSIGILGLSLLAYLTFYQISISEVRNDFLINNGEHFRGFLYHYLDFALISGILYLLVYIIKKGNSGLKEFRSQSFSVLSVYILIVLSVELDHLVAWIGYNPGSSISHILEQNHKIGFPVLWGIYSFVLMWIGMRFKNRQLRIVSMFILLVTLLKLFIYDIRDVSEAGKILAFVCLGVLLLVISFMYQRLKKLIINDEKSAE